nr:histone-lysine N-methyltransferase, H3 lysine-36 specific-like [Procambarus clarkii]
MSGKAMSDSFTGGSDDEDEESMDVKPTIETNNNSSSTPPTQGPLPPPTLTPNPSALAASPAGITAPTAGLAAAMMSGGRPNTPTRSLGVVPPTSTTPLLEPMSVGENKVNNAFPGFNVSMVTILSISVCVCVTPPSVSCVSRPLVLAVCHAP